MYADGAERRTLKRKAENQGLHKEIEKRRRDRINQSLMELSQVIPATFSKQSNRRLEKAEILEMTVHYIRAVTNTEIGARFQQGDWYSSDIWADFIHHYQSGYSDCMRELHNFYLTTGGQGAQGGGEGAQRVLAFLKSRYRPESSVAEGEAYKRARNAELRMDGLKTEETRPDFKNPNSDYTGPAESELRLNLDQRKVEQSDLRLWNPIPFHEYGNPMMNPFRHQREESQDRIVT